MQERVVSGGDARLHDIVKGELQLVNAASGDLNLHEVIDGGDAKLHNIIAGNASLQEIIAGEGSTFMPVNPPSYIGATNITPSIQTQTLQTAGLMLPSNIVINPIPSNYGLITWNGSTLTVS